MNKETSYRTFVRFGKFAPVKQKGFNKNDTFHSPPTTYGFYAMPLKFQDLFLVGSVNKTQPKLFQEINSEKYKNEEGKYDYDALDKAHKNMLFQHYQKFTIKPEEEFWHHLGDYVKNSDVLARSKDWVKTTYSVWYKALMKCNVSDRSSFISLLKLPLNEIKKGRGHVSVDHLEVFFDKKIS